MYLQFALAALLALSGISAAIEAAPGSVSGSPMASTSTSQRTTPSTSDATETPSDEVSLEERDVIVPPVDATEAPASTDALPEPQAATGEVMADQLVAPDRVESKAIEADGFQTVGVTWPEGSDVAELGGQVRTRTDGTWSEWVDLEPGEDAPDAGTSDAQNAVRGGTEPVSIGDVDAVQLAFAASAQGGPDGLSLTLIGSEESPASDGVVTSAAHDQATIRTAAYTSGAVQAAVGAPRVISRAEWGAPAQVCTPDVASELVGAVVHHTAGSNDYANVAQAMQQIRNDAAYHISGRGWCDIGYNFIVDKWGNIYEGRANSLTEPVIGVHDGGFNTGTVGVSMLGTYDGVPSAATQQSVAQIIGWRLGAYGVDPRGTMTYYTGAGENSKFLNQNVSIARVFGHRDTAYTACPGNGGYAALPNIRNIAWDVSLTAPPINARPIGSVDSIVTTANSISVSGWTLDQDTWSPNEAHIYIDGVGVAVTSNLSRPDVALAYGKGDRHGFTHSRTLPAGEHSMCVYSIDTSGGPNRVLDCRTVTVGVIVPRTPPMGSLDAVSVSNTAIALSGWALDPDTNDPNEVHVYIDGVGVAVRADQSRPDVAAAFGHGDRHGFSFASPATPGRHDLCVHSINTGPGSNTLLGCRTVDVPDTLPMGAVDSIVATNTAISVTGWTLDRDTWVSNEAHVYIDGVGTALRADQSRPDVSAAFGWGDRHGFGHTFAAAPGAHGICVFAINTSAGANTTLTCRTIVVPDAAPIGSVDAIVAGPGSLTFSGWTLDPDTWESNQTHIYIDGIGVAIRADQSRPDVAAVFGRGANHGFSYTARVAPGNRSMCVYGINTAQGPNTLLSCRNIVVP